MQHLVGGISSAGRSVPPLDGEALFVSRASGPCLWTETGQRLIDTALGFGAVILGHADEGVNEAIRGALARGSMPAFAHQAEEEAASALSAPCGPLSSVMFTNSGSEAVHMACRVARAVTGRGTIAKIAAGYNGWFDEVTFGNTGSSDALLGNSPRPVRGGVTLTRYNDIADAEQLFAESDDIAAVIIEPMLANAGSVEADLAYLQALREMATRHGALFIADEVLMGFRTRFGLASQGLGIEPDLATVGKAIGNGTVVAALLGRPEIMKAAHDGRAIRAGTYSGNPLAASAVIATMSALAEADYDGLSARGARFREGFAAAFAERGLPLVTSGRDMVFTTWFAAAAPRSYEEALAIADPEKSLRLHLELRRAGLISMPQPFGRHFLSFAHDDALITEMVEVVHAAVRRLPLDRVA